MTPLERIHRAMTAHHRLTVELDAAGADPVLAAAVAEMNGPLLLLGDRLTDAERLASGTDRPKRPRAL